MNTKHTPGPWESIGQIIVGGHPLEHICRWDGRPSNAKLIEAAPDLLEACQELIAELDNRESQYGYPDTGGMILARMAIQKAGAE